MKTRRTSPPNRLMVAGQAAKVAKGRQSIVELVPSLLKLQSILVPIDFSAESEKALVYAVSFARQFGAKLELLHVVELIPLPECVRALQNEHLARDCRAHLNRVIDDLEIERDLIGRVTVRSGRAFHEIAEAARMLKVDLIIMATHGYGRVKHAMLGSTAERVVQFAPCPVLVVRAHEREFVRIKNHPSERL